MASTSAQMAIDSSSFIRGYNYDVFLSFRGEDTRNNFTDHLYTALVRRGIITFRDDKLRRGEEIAPELLKAIEESRSSVVVFSKTYADSRWCLDELAKIMESRRECRQIVLPIFYHVNPSDVRKQTGSFGKAFTSYEENWKNKAQRWREALTEAGNLSGWHIEEGYESKHIHEILEVIRKRLSPKHLHVDDDMVGMDSRLEELKSLINSQLHDIHLVGIYGTGGLVKLPLPNLFIMRFNVNSTVLAFLKMSKRVSKRIVNFNYNNFFMV